MRRSAFTMLELIFVIVVMGILAKFGVEIYLQIFNNYANTIDTTSKEQKTQNAIEVIAKRLSERIPESTQLTTTGIKWVGKDVDGWNGGVWSGIADIAPTTDTNATFIESPGSDMSAFVTSNNYALFFRQNDAMSQSMFYNANGVIYPISGTDTSGTHNAFVLSRAAGRGSEHYVISEYAYELSYDSSTKKLMLKTSKPWNGGGSTSYLLADHISGFSIINFKRNAGGFLVKLCMERNDFTGEGSTSICKQKFIY
jgi:prepilin-type N-terminal cleavage/methylation domain-containing protein